MVWDRERRKTLFTEIANEDREDIEIGVRDLTEVPLMSIYTTYGMKK